MSTCEACAQHARTESESVGAADNARFGRLVLAALNGAPDAVALVHAEAAGCHDCTSRLLGAGLGMCTGLMLTLGSVEAAAEEQSDPPATPPLTDEQRGEAAHQYAIRTMEQIVMDANDLEAGPG